MTGTAGETAHRTAPWRRLSNASPWLAAARVLLVVAWLGWAGIAWWTAPRAATVDQTRSDVAAGRIDSFARASSVGRDGRFWGDLTAIRTRHDGDLLAWRTDSGRVRFTAPDRDWPRDRQGADPSGSAAGSVIETLTGELRAAGVPEHIGGVDGGRLADRGEQLASLLAGTGVLLVLLGPTPARGTRWFWFWVGMIPFGLGAVSWLALERPWSARATELRWRQECGGGPARRSGWLGLAFLLLCGIGLGIAAGALRAVLGPEIIPG